MKKNCHICWTDNVKQSVFHFLNTENKINLKRLQQFSISINCAYAIFENKLYAWIPETENIYFDSFDFTSTTPIQFDNFGAQKVSKIYCNSKICHIITEDNQIFSWGTDRERTGILGMGEVYCIPSPTLNSNFLGKRIIDLSISEKHGAAIDELHQLYTWGESFYGEIGESNHIIKTIPSIVSVKNFYPLKVRCGYSYTIMLDYDKTPIYFGAIADREDIEKNINKINSNGPHEVPFDRTLRVRCENVACGDKRIAILDTDNNLFIYSDYEGLYLVKVYYGIKNVKFIYNNIYAIGKEQMCLYEFTSYNGNEDLEEYVENVYIPDNRLSNVDLIETPYYDNVLFFSIESEYDFYYLMRNMGNKLFMQVRNSNMTYQDDPIGNEVFNYYANNSNCLKSNKSIINYNNENGIQSSNISQNFRAQIKNANVIGDKNSLVSNPNSFQSYAHSPKIKEQQGKGERIKRISTLLDHLLFKKIKSIEYNSNASRNYYYYINKKRIEVEKLAHGWKCVKRGNKESYRNIYYHRSSSLDANCQVIKRINEKYKGIIENYRALSSDKKRGNLKKILSLEKEMNHNRFKKNIMRILNNFQNEDNDILESNKGKGEEKDNYKGSKVIDKSKSIMVNIKVIEENQNEESMVINKISNDESIMINKISNNEMKNKEIKVINNKVNEKKQNEQEDDDIVNQFKSEKKTIENMRYQNYQSINEENEKENKTKELLQKEPKSIDINIMNNCIKLHIVKEKEIFPYDNQIYKRNTIIPIKQQEKEEKLNKIPKKPKILKVFEEFKALPIKKEDNSFEAWEQILGDFTKENPNKVKKETSLNSNEKNLQNFTIKVSISKKLFSPNGMNNQIYHLSKIHSLFIEIENKKEKETKNNTIKNTININNNFQSLPENIYDNNSFLTLITRNTQANNNVLTLSSSAQHNPEALQAKNIKNNFMHQIYHKKKVKKNKNSQEFPNRVYNNKPIVRKEETLIPYKSKCASSSSITISPKKSSKNCSSEKKNENSNNNSSQKSSYIPCKSNYINNTIFNSLVNRQKLKKQLSSQNITLTQKFNGSKDKLNRFLTTNDNSVISGKMFTPCMNIQDSIKQAIHGNVDNLNINNNSNNNSNNSNNNNSNSNNKNNNSNALLNSSVQNIQSEKKNPKRTMKRISSQKILQNANIKIIKKDKVKDNKNVIPQLNKIKISNSNNNNNSNSNSMNNGKVHHKQKSATLSGVSPGNKNFVKISKKEPNGKEWQLYRLRQNYFGYLGNIYGKDHNKMINQLLNPNSTNEKDENCKESNFDCIYPTEHTKDYNEDLMGYSNYTDSEPVTVRDSASKDQRIQTLLNKWKNMSRDNQMTIASEITKFGDIQLISLSNSNSNMSNLGEPLELDKSMQSTVKNIKTPSYYDKISI